MQSPSARELIRIQPAYRFRPQPRRMAGASRAPSPAASPGALRPFVRRRDRPRADGRRAAVRKSCFMPIAIFDSETMPRDRRAELEAAVVAAGKHLTKLFEGWIVATPGRRKFAVRITSYPELDISVMVDWNAMAADVTERVRAADD